MKSIFASASATEMVDFFFGEGKNDSEITSDDEECVECYYSDEEDDPHFQEEEVIITSNNKTKVILNNFGSKSTSTSKTSECSICITDYSDEPEELITIQECFHKFCKSCLSNYVAFKTADISHIYHVVTLISKEKSNALKVDVLKTYGVTCPAHHCKHVMLINEITPVATNNVLEQFDRFSKVHQENLQRLKQEQENNKPKELECPRCGEKKEHKKIRRNRMQCKKCFCPFCRVCGHAHPPSVSCESFKNDNPLAAIKGLQRCPKCFYFTEKVDGCNYMTCKCGANFCNLCGATLNSDKHWSHFKGAPFGDICLGKSDGIGSLRRRK